MMLDRARLTVMASVALVLSLVTDSVHAQGHGRASVPVPVSPGAESAATLVEARCPTFSWAGTAAAASYRLAVLRVGADEGQEPELVALVELPADSRAFTPAFGQCLDRGERYAWSVAAVADGGDGGEEMEWSPAFLFEVASAAEVSDAESVDQAVAVLERYLAQRGAQGAEVDLARRESALAANRGGRETASRESRRDAAARGARGRVEEEERREERAEDLDGVVRVAAAAAPTLGLVSLKVSNQVHLAPASAVFKGGEVFLWDDTTGNTALGREALKSVSIGTRNTAVGRQALRNTTGGTSFGGSFNTAVGDLALLANSSGKRNTATGSDALLANNVGSGNTATGTSALLSNILGEYNVATGAFALRNNIEGNRNTAAGFMLFAPLPRATGTPPSAPTRSAPTRSATPTPRSGWKRCGRAREVARPRLVLAR